jgi:uncharacterized protein (DUF849 family)
MLIKIALNGGRAGAPSTAEEIARDVAACVAVGATVFHVHPRDAAGAESLLPEHADPVIRAIRATAPDVSVGLTTGAWILPEVPKRLAAIRGWTELPDFASVNFDEEGCEDVARLLISRGIGVEAGVLDVASTERFLAASVDVVRVLIEIQEQTVNAALEQIIAIEHLLGDHRAPRLLHGHGAVVWDMVDEAARRGYDTRIGREDVHTDESNVQLFRRASDRSRLESS